MKLIQSMLIAAPLMISPLAGLTNETGVADAKAAVQRLAQQDDVAFAYQRLSDYGERTMQERYRPLPDSHGWTLVSENGQKPDTQRLAEYQQMKNDEWQSGQHNQDTEEQDQQSVRLSLSDLVQADTLAFVGQQNWRNMPVRAFSFTPYLDKFSEHDDKLQGHLYLAADSGQIKGIAIDLKESFSPAMSVTLDSFAMSIELMPITHQQNIYYVPQTTEQSMSGSYLYFKDFSNSTRRTYSDYSVVDAESVKRVSAN